MASPPDPSASATPTPPSSAVDGTPSPGEASDEARSEAVTGLLYTTGAFLLWGVSPLFWKLLKEVSAQELLAHRIVWSGAMMLVLLLATRQLGSLVPLLRSPRTVLQLVVATLLIAVNWFLYIWAVNNDRILEVSLGYYINPLLNVVLGMAFLGERLRRVQWISVSLALLGVLVMTLDHGGLPWISLVLAASFGFYGLARKTFRAGPAQGLALETWFLAPWMLLYLSRLEGQAFGSLGWTTDLLLVATGLMTALPLLWFNHGAKRLPLSTVGLLQYLAPTGQFLIAVLVFHEPFPASRAAAFGLIWLALAIFTWDTRRQWRQRTA